MLFAARVHGSRRLDELSAASGKPNRLPARWKAGVRPCSQKAYIGGLWPLRDAPALRFAVTFYQIIADNLQQNRPALVADALAQARRLVYETGDATYLAYAFYGDAQLQFIQAR